ncbi:BAQ_1a_G0017700.mRNA.1.CDS.1 [Saccharomyces cerevisiae]|nr:BAQ_1a_G0017700.mRNA.1.CDS.1 [Saccharomyces cerevisiae]CAI7111273.1 BAQ_1a_G0017700.mRNA.1.CDS.1 [Saccharomyces cerevisiae]
MENSFARRNNRLVGNFENYFNTIIGPKKDTISTSYIWKRESFTNKGSTSMRGTFFASAIFQELIFSSFNGTIINTGNIAAQSYENNQIPVILQSTVVGKRVSLVGNCAIFYIEDLNNISVEEQTIVLSSEPNAIVLGYFADLPSRQPPVTTQLWQSGRPLNAEVLRTTKVKTMLFAYSGCLAPQCIPDISSFKALPFRDTESRFTTDSSVISSRFSSSFTSNSSKIIIITSIFSSKMDNEHVGASLIVSLSMASLIVTNVFSFSSISYSSQPSDYIACSPSGIDD